MTLNFISLHSLHRTFMETCIFCPAKLCRLCPPKSRQHSFRGQNNNKSYLKKIFSYLKFFFFCKSLLFQRYTQQLRKLFKKNIFSRTVPLKKKLFGLKKDYDSCIFRIFEKFDKLYVLAEGQVKKPTLYVFYEHYIQFK